MSDTTVARQAGDDPGSDSVRPARVPGLPRIGLMGEFSAGKTTLINFLLGDDVLPVRVTATQMPPVWIAHGPRAAHYIGTDGTRTDIALEDLATISVEGVRYVKLTCESDLLAEFELFDTPGISDPNIPDEYRQAVVDFVDSVIWCTHAPQAWRESERSAWVQMPERLQQTSILLATRADKLNDRDRGRVEARLRHETGAHFRDIILFSTLDAIRACEMEDGEALFASSGADRLVGELRRIAGEVSGVALPDAAEMAAAEAPARSGVVVALQPNRVRPARVQRASEGARGRISREEADALAGVVQAEADPQEDARGAQPLVLDESHAADAAATAHRTDVLDLSSFRVAVPQPDEQVPESASWMDDPVAEPGAVLADGWDDLPVAQVSREAFVEAGEDPDVDAVADLAQDDGVLAAPDAMEDEDAANQPVPPDADDLAEVLANIGRVVSAEADAQADLSVRPAAGSGAAALWQEVLAEGPVETVPDVLAAVARLLVQMERRGMIALSRAEVDSAGQDAHI